MSQQNSPTQNPILNSTIARAQSLARHMESLAEWQVAHYIPGVVHREALLLLAVAAELEAMERRDSSDVLAQDLAKLRKRVRDLETRPLKY